MKPDGKWGFAIRRVKKNCFICVSKDGYADQFNDADRQYLMSLFGGNSQNISEGVYRFPSAFNVEPVLLAEGFEKNENRAKMVLDYMKERGSLK